MLIAAVGGSVETRYLNLHFQAGFALVALGIFAFLQDRLSLAVAISMLIVFLGTAISSIPIRGMQMIPFQDIQEMLSYFLGIISMAVSAVSQAGRLTYQELSYASFQGVSSLELMSFVSVFSATVLVLLAVVAQALPGQDNGCLVHLPTIFFYSHLKRAMIQVFRLQHSLHHDARA